MKAPQAEANETILLVEDDAIIRELSARILAHAGYRVLTAENGEEAEALFSRHADGVDLLLLDVVMPKMGGHEAHERIQRIRAGVPTLFTSGYSVNAIHTNFVLKEGLQLIQKPYSPAALLHAVRRALDKGKRESAP